MKDTRARLIDATFDEIYLKGYVGASLSTILNTANVKKGSMYHHFSSKKQMVLCMIKETYKSRIEDYWRDLEHTNANILNALIAILKSRDKDFTNGCPLGNIVQECSNLDDDFKNLLDDIFQSWEELFEHAIKKAVLNREIKKVEEKELAIFLIAVYEGALLMSKRSGSSIEYIKCVNQLELLLNTLKI